MDVDKSILEGGGDSDRIAEVIVGEQIESEEEGGQGLYFNNQQSW